MYIILQPDELRRVGTWPVEAATKTHRIIITPQLSVLIEVCWKPFEELGDVTEAWIEIKFFSNSDDLLWTRIGNYPLHYIARSYE